MKTDLEIAQGHTMLPIVEIGKKLGLEENMLECYGKYKAKITGTPRENHQGKLILVTSTNPTPYGEGKTTMAIGLSDALCKLGCRSLPVLREPSLGPVFGIKGGATGGGYAQVVPMEDINLHFTGDMHALTSANNLLCAAIDNHIFQGNELKIDKNRIMVSRAMDMNDRALRNITVGSKEDKREDSFVITVASELMAILCLAENLEDLKARIARICIGYNLEGKPLYVRDLHVEGAMTLLLKDAIKPNLVQTLEGNPAILHGGPFANIAHGCNSLIATKMGLSLADYVVTEAGFGSDLGAEKFLDIKCRYGNLKPSVIVLNTTIRSLKYNGGATKETLDIEDLDSLKNGIVNLKAHIENMQKYLNHVVVCINQFESDTEEELNYVKNYCENLGVSCACSSAHTKGSAGSLELAQLVLDTCKEDSKFQLLYQDEVSLMEKIEKVSHEIYRASDIQYEQGVLEKLKQYEAMGYGSLPVCIAKTQYSLSDDAKKLGLPEGHTMTVRDVNLNSGAGFIVVLMGNIMTMPGLPKHPNYEKIDIKKDGTVVGLF